MSVVRAVAWSGALVLAIAAVVSGQQQPAGRSAGAGGRGTGSAASSGSVQRGQYLVERVVMCYECHSTRDAQGDIVPGTRFMGGPMPMRPTWTVDWPTQIPRIAGFAGYTDEEAMRVLTEGAIKRDGTQLRLPMPRFRMNAQDAADVIAYLRTQ